MSTDALSEVLRAVRLRGAVFFSVETGGSWVAEAPASREIAGRIMPGVDHVIEYHLVTAGSCFGGIVGEPPLELHAGDVIVFPQGDPHVLSSAPGMRGSVDLDQYEPPRARPLPICLKTDGDPTATEVVCGFLGCDARPFNPLLAALPRVSHLRPRGPRDELLGALVRHAVAESASERPGSESSLARLSELLFIEVVRRNLETLAEGETGWLAGLRDECVGRALQHLHDRPSHGWTLESLAKQSGMSRSALADRFAHLVGLPPMQYLAQWRMQLAARLLESRSTSIADVAEQVGYGSEAAFSRAFKKLVGTPPALFRESSWVRPLSAAPNGGAAPGA